MGRSWDILTNMKTSLLAFHNANPNGQSWIIENHSLDDIELADRNDVSDIRISIYEDGDDANVITGAQRAKDTTQDYEVSISKVIARRQDMDDNVEKGLMDAKDTILDWLDDLDAQAIDDDLFSIGWIGSTETRRVGRFATMEAQISAYRNLNNL